MTDEKKETKLARSDKSSLDLFYVVEDGNALNKLVHSGPRLGQLVVPFSLIGAGFMTYRTLRKQRDMREELLDLELDLEEYEDLRELQEEEESGNPSPFVTQSVLLSVDRFNKREAKKWIRDHGYMVGEPDKTMSFFRFRQHDPSEIDRQSYVTLEINDDVKLIRGIPR